ncbi:MAG TPA: hypothetical protein VNC41_18525 [Acidimicrobiia bacterium]|nr:hypothetical protein [Acidimicrobiia bacterium]
MTAEERQTYDRISDEISTLDREKESLLASPEAQRELETANGELARVAAPSERSRTDNEQALREFRTPGSRTTEINIDLGRRSYGSGGWYEHRGIFGDTGSSGGSLTIPNLVHDTILKS